MSSDALCLGGADLASRVSRHLFLTLHQLLLSALDGSRKGKMMGLGVLVKAVLADL